MPIYEYQCTECGHALEAIQKMSEAPLSDCPQCGKSSLQKRVSAVGFRLKGGGWYETDFKKTGRKNVAGSESGSGAGSGSATPAKSATEKA